MRGFLLILVGGALLCGLSYAMAQTPSRVAKDGAILRVTSTTATPIIFDAAYIGDSMQENGHMLNQSTPFEMAVASEDFQIVLHKRSGPGDMRVTLENSRGHVEVPHPIALVVKQGTRLSATGLR
jgi:hypothetical protein